MHQHSMTASFAHFLAAFYLAASQRIAMARIREQQPRTKIVIRKILAMIEHHRFELGGETSFKILAHQPDSILCGIDAEAEKAVFPRCDNTVVGYVMSPADLWLYIV